MDRSPPTPTSHWHLPALSESGSPRGCILAPDSPDNASDPAILELAPAAQNCCGAIRAATTPPTRPHRGNPSYVPVWLSRVVHSPATVQTGLVERATPASNTRLWIPSPHG